MFTHGCANPHLPGGLRPCQSSSTHWGQCFEWHLVTRTAIQELLQRGAGAGKKHHMLNSPEEAFKAPL